jgi:hypothetical protein
MSARTASRRPARAEQDFEGIKRSAIEIYSKLDEVLVRDESPTLASIVALHILLEKAFGICVDRGVLLEELLPAIEHLVASIRAERGGDA